jgi:CRISPR-associated endonuclease/helicase Cas3
MEAGIDVDFPIGFRAMAGLDSIIQAAGRVNREMRQASGDIYVFTPQTDFIKRTPKFIEQTAAVAEATLREHADDPTAIAAIEAYYSMLYTLHSERSFDEKGIVDHFEKGTRQLDFDFKTAAEKFKLIDESSVTVLIPYDEEARRQIDSLQYANYPAAILRRLQSYAVNIYEQEFTALQSKGAIHTIADTYHALDPSRMADYYHPRTGLMIPERSGGDALFFD